MKKILIFTSLALAFAACDKKNGGDTDVVPSLSINDIAQTEGNSGTTVFSFTASLYRPTSKQVTVTYSTQDGTATSGSDFKAVTNGTLTFAPNETSKQISIEITSDAVKEAEEKFTVVISNAVNATILKATGTASIQNDDNGSFGTLVWSDEFNGTALDAANWSFENGDGCPSMCGWGNNELEYYRPENLSFDGSNMIIEARKEAFGGRQYTSSKIVSRGKKTFKFGKIEFRAKLPKGKGIWPAFWMLPQNNVFGGWPKSGELDILEMVGHEPNKVYGTLHFGPGPGSTQISRGYTLNGSDFSADFHTFSIVWDTNSIEWFVDGNLFSTVKHTDMGSATYPFNEDFFFIINLAVGGQWPGAPDATTVFPQRLIVDYVRVYQ